MTRDPQEDIAWSYMLGQHAGKARLEALVKSYFSPNTKLTAALDRLCNALDLDLAFGTHLDYIGSIVGVSRALPLGLFMAYFGFKSQPAGRAFNTLRMRRDGEPISTSYTANDAEYKTLIRLKIMQNNARGTAPEIIEAVRSVFGDPDLPVSVRQNGTGKAKVVIGQIPNAEDPTPQLLVDRVPRAAGVSFSFEYYRGTLELDFLSLAADADMTFTRSTTGSYIDDGVLKYAAINAPRWCRDYTTGLPLGLLNEPSGQNLFSYTEAFSNAYWSKFNAAFVDASLTGPDGLLSACNMTVLAGSSSGNCSRIPTGPTAENAYSFSIFIKDNGWKALCEAAGAVGNFQIQFYEVGTPYIFKGGVTVNLADMVMQTPSSSNGSTVTGYVEKMANGWARICATCVFAGTVGATVQARHIIGYSGSVPVSDGVAGVAIFGAQCESRRSVTSYYKNVGNTQGTRGADVIDFTATGKAWNNDDQGTMFIEYEEKFGHNSGTSNLISLWKDADEYTLMRHAYGAIPRIESRISNVALQWDSAVFPITIDGITRAALSYSVSGAALFMNGVKCEEIGSYSRPRGYTSLQIRSGGNSRFLRKAYVFPTKKSDSELIAATTL